MDRSLVLAINELNAAKREHSGLVSIQEQRVTTAHKESGSLLNKLIEDAKQRVRQAESFFTRGPSPLCEAEASAAERCYRSRPKEKHNV